MIADDAIRGRARVALGLALAASLAVAASLATDRGRPAAPRLEEGVELSGRVVGPGATGAAGAFVTVRRVGTGLRVTVLTAADGSYRFPGMAAGRYAVEARLPGRPAAAPRDTTFEGGATRLELEVPGSQPVAELAASSTWLTRLPEGETKRRFILDCTGCHQLGPRVVDVQGRPRTREEWVAAVGKMLSFAGAKTSFPIISADREPEATADWLVRHLGGSPGAEAGAGPAVGEGSESRREDPDTRPAAYVPPRLPAGEAERVVITEYDLPSGPDLPHDLMLDPQGRIVVTGMFRNVMYRLDPESGRFEEIPIPVADANPRVLEIDPGGVWWVLLGGPQKLGRRDAATGEWTTWDLGMYPHSVARAEDGKIWFNGHFTKDPELIGRLDPETGDIRTFEVPPAPVAGGGSAIPYELRLGPDGAVWGTELAGNRVFRFSPDEESFEIHEVPTPHAGPRRLDVDRGGIAWIPEYSAGKLARLDPSSGEIRELDLPTRDALPYVARADPERGWVWVAEAGADAIARFDPRTGAFVEYPLPTPSALIRHMEVDRRTGAVWAAYSPAPPVHPRIVRLELREP